ncbi:sensor histidine kinase [uncultured Massilia sp.]|uniref:sensor histidine kinase n=1 Tax=uncultured Massilia sp. TaxID=169973 RepID=UPI0025DAE267|nr:histidine kinase dimerization/phosphoacceptor domain -containing protein [uncultured Massilia sp.]
MRLHDLMRRAPTIRRWLAMLLAAVIVPAAAAVSVLFVHSYQRERAAAERAALDVARALMQAIDLELASAQGALQALATSPNLDRGDLRAFYGQAVDVLHFRPGNILVLTDRHLDQLVNTHVPYGAPLPHHGNAALLDKVLRNARPTVSDLYTGPTVRRLLTSVDVPVLRDGRVSYVLSMQYFGERLGTILERQRIPPDATATIYDSGARIVWRSRGTTRDVGRGAHAALAAGLLLEAEGTVDEADPDGRPLVTVFSRSSVSRWAVAIELRRSALNAGLWHSLAWIGAGTLALFALGLALVRAIGARIERSIRGLVRPAIALGYGAPVALPPLHLREAKDVGHALVQAAALLRERTAQRDAAERAERQLRESSRAIERSEAFLRGVFEESPDGVLLVDADCRLTRANAQAEQLFGYPHGALAGLAIDTLLVDAAQQARPVCDRVRAIARRTGTDGMTELLGQRRDGTRFPADAMVSPLRERALVILTVRDMSVSKEREVALRRALDDKNILLKELYHRVKNNLQLLISLFNLQVRTLDDGRARRALEDAGGRVRAMALVHERLYQSRTLSSIALDSYVGELCEQLAGTASAPQRGVAVRVEAAPAEVGLDVAAPLGLLLNELVWNCLNHAFPDGRGGSVRVRLEREDEGTMRLTVADDGVGLPATLDRTSSRTLGLKLIAALSEQLHARFTLDNAPDGPGAVATLVFPLSFPLPGGHGPAAMPGRHAAPKPPCPNEMMS